MNIRDYERETWKENKKARKMDQFMKFLTCPSIKKSLSKINFEEQTKNKISVFPGFEVKSAFCRTFADFTEFDLYDSLY